MNHQQTRTEFANAGGHFGGGCEQDEFPAGLRNGAGGNAEGELIDGEPPELAAVAVLGYN